MELIGGYENSRSFFLWGGGTFNSKSAVKMVELTYSIYNVRVSTVVATQKPFNY